MTNHKKIKKARELSDAQLKEEIAQLREEYFMRRFKADDPKQIKNSGHYREVRRTIARYLTVLNERAAKLDAEKNKQAAQAKAAAQAQAKAVAQAKAKAAAQAKQAAKQAAKQPAPPPVPVAPSIVPPKKK